MITLDLLTKPSLSVEEESSVLELLEGGAVIVYPTDTLYGLGADACSKVAVAEIYRLKNRVDAPVSVLTSSVDELLNMMENLSPRVEELAKTFLPGALTLICRSNYPFARQLVSSKGTVGFRVPGDGISTRIAAALGRPITTTSVNPAGAAPATSLEEVRHYYGAGIPLMINKGPISGSLGSTVIDVSSEPFQILREGEITRQVLLDFIN